MGSWYTIGILVGVGVSLGVFAVAATGRLVLGGIAAAIVAAAIGFVAWRWGQAAGGGVGAVCGAAGATPLVSGALRRGGTRGGTATLLGLASLAVAALALIPVVGYLEAIAVPLLGLRLRRRAPETHAGLRSLARD